MAGRRLTPSPERLGSKDSRMETRAGYIAVGVAVLAILSFGIGFVIWMGSQSGAERYDS